MVIAVAKSSLHHQLQQGHSRYSARKVTGMTPLWSWSPGYFILKTKMGRERSILRQNLTLWLPLLIILLSQHCEVLGLQAWATIPWLTAKTLDLPRAERTGRCPHSEKLCSFMCISVGSTSTHHIHAVPDTCRGQERAIKPLGLEL